MLAGTRFTNPRPKINDRQRQGSGAQGIPIHVLQMQGQRADLLRHALRHLQAEPEKLVQLSAKNDHGDAAGESGHDRIRKKFQEPPHLERAYRNEHHARHHRGEREAAIAILRDDREKDRNKRTSRSRDLKTRAAEKCNREPGDNTRPQSLLWRRPGCDGETDCERQRNNSDRDSGQRSAEKSARL